MADTQSYGLEGDFEVILISAMCDREKLFARVGQYLDPDGLEYAATKLALRAAKSISMETGTGPKSQIMVLQRLKRWLHDGKITQEEINEVIDVFDEADALDIPDDDALVSEIAPLLKHQEREKAVDRAIETFAKQGDMAKVGEQMIASSRIGEAQNSAGVGFEGAFDEIDTVSRLERMPSGILELDSHLEGGYERGSLWCWVGGPGDGKSMALIQGAANAVLEGYNVCLATLELNRARTWARIISNITGIPINAVLNGNSREAQEFMQGIGHRLGMLKVEYFSPKSTTIDDIRTYVERVQDQTKKEIQKVSVDYADKLGVAKAQGEYIDMRYVFEGYRHWMEDSNRWGETAAQAKRKKEKQKHTGIDDMADSQHKARVCDGVISIDKDEDGLSATIVKNRNGIADVTVGPYQPKFMCARIAPVNRDYEALRSNKAPQGTLLN